MYKKVVLIHCMLMMLLVAQAQEIGVRTSAVLWATATPNIELNYALGKHLTAHLPIQYNPFVFKENSRFQQLTVMPGMRYWFNIAHAQGFVSAYGVASRFHVGGWLGDDYRYDGKCFGGGIGGGYSWILSKRLNIEVEAGIGFVYADYDKCGWRPCSKRYAHGQGLRIMPCKYDVSLVYFF